METLKQKYVFQVDSDIVKQAFELQNYLIVYDEGCKQKDYCAIYFSSNDIYFPNNEQVFTKRILEKDFYEWYNIRIKKAYKHIFIRDIFKQWYLGGINSEINSPEKLLTFLQKETEGLNIIALGSSAGGYSAVLYGQLLRAEKILSFNGQFELNRLLNESKEEINPLLFRFMNSTLRTYYDLNQYIVNQSKIYYFCSNKSKWDITQYNHIKELTDINVISFNTSHHGIPFLKNCLLKVINYDIDILKLLSNKTHNSIVFSLKVDGLINALKMLWIQLKKKYL